MSYTKGHVMNKISYSRHLVYDEGIFVGGHEHSSTTGQVGRSLTGEYNPTWRDKVRLHQNATTELSAVEFVSNVTPTHNYIKHYTFEQIDVEYNHLNPVFLSDDGLASAVDNEARIRAARQIGAKFNTYTFFGELRESLRMIRNPAVGLRRLVDKYRRQNENYRRKTRNSRIGMRDYQKHAAESWLEYSFGWRPLLNDVSDAIDAYRDMVYSERFLKFDAHHKATTRDYIPKQNAFGWNLAMYANSSQRVTSYRTRYLGEVKLDTFCANISNSFGLGPKQFIPAAWELLPYSWLIDYFTNIGDVLDAYATLSTADFAWVCRTDVCRQTDLRKHVYIGTKHDVDIFTPGVGHFVKKSVQRTALDSVPIPSLQMRAKLSTSKGLNIGALARLKAEDILYRR